MLPTLKAISTLRVTTNQWFFLGPQAFKINLNISAPSPYPLREQSS